MNEQFIQHISIDWNKIEENSYLRKIEAIRLAKGFRKAKWGYFLRSESFYNVATKEEEYADMAHPSRKYHQQSHGESFLALAQNSFRPNGILAYFSPFANACFTKLIIT